MSINRTYQLANTLTVAFLEKYLAGSHAYDHYLQPAWYQAQSDLNIQTKN